MKNTPIKKVSKKRRAILSREAIQVKLLLEQCKGFCMICGKPSDWRGLQKSHTRTRGKFILVCAECHSPDGKHKYLEEHSIEEL